MIHNDTNKMPKNAAAYICDNCGKQYTYHSGLSRHKQKCNVQKMEETNEQNTETVKEIPIQEHQIGNDNTDYKEMFIHLMKQNQEQQNTVVEQQKQYTETINEMIPRIGNNNNNQFNLQFFLNEQCKDCLLYTSPSPRDRQKSRMPSSA